MASWGDSHSGGRYPARFDSGSTSGLSRIPSTCAINARLVSTRCHSPGYRSASSARSAASASATPSSMFDVWYAVPVAGMMSSCSAIPDSWLTTDPEYTGEPGHPVLEGVPRDWPPLLGYNRLMAKSAAQVLVRCDADPLLTVGGHGAGRGAAFASDCAPHWCPPGFMAWPGYDPLWGNLIHWLAGQR